MAGKFVIKKGESGKFHFNLVAGNGQVIATSQAYHSKESAPALLAKRAEAREKMAAST